VARGPTISILMSVVAMFGCSGGSPTPSRPFEDGQAISQATQPDTAGTKSDISALPGYDTVSQFLAELLAQNQNLRDSVDNAASLAECMLTNAYQLNGIPIPGGRSQESSTSVPFELLLSPMLVYLAETCSGIPATSWAE
jgi:hypothetical protein